MKRKWVPVSFNYLQCDEMADWLGKMAGRGWNFRRFCFGFLFDACEPEEQVYDVQVFLKNKNDQHREDNILPLIVRLAELSIQGGLSLQGSGGRRSVLTLGASKHHLALKVPV